MGRSTFEESINATDPEKEFLRLLHVSDSLFAFNVVSMCVCPLVLLIVAWHVVHFIMLPLRNYALEHSSWKHIQWAPTRRANWLLIIIIMPVALSIAVMRANLRIWELLSGQG